MSNRKIDNLREPSNLQLKVKTGYPTAIDAKEGVVTLRYIPGTGLALFAYYANRWSMTKLSNLNAKDESIVENLKVKNLEIDKSAKFNASSVDISEKNIPSIRKWDKSYNDIRSGEIEANFKKTKVKEDLQIGPDNSKILLKNNNNKLNIRNADDSADIQLEIGYGGTGASTEDGALDNLGGTTVGKNVFKAASESAARSAISVDAAGTDNSTPVTFAAGAKDYLSLSGQEITVGLVDLSDNVTGSLPKGSVDSSGTWAASDIPNLSADKITTDSFHLDRIPTITNAKLQNDSISLGGVSVDLGSSDATPAFDLSDSTNTNLDSIKSGTQIAAANISDVESFSQSGTYANLRAQATTKADVGLGSVTDGADVTDSTSVANAGAVMDGDFSSNGLMKRTGSGSYGIATDNSSNWDDAHTHVSASGSSHSLLSATAGTLTESKAIIVDANGRIDEIKPELITVGSGTSQGTIKSNGDHNITIATGNSTTGSISIVDGANGTINLTSNGTGAIRVGSGSNPGHITTKGGYDLKLSTNDDSNSGTITITDGVSGDITIAPQRNTVTASPIVFTHVTTDGGSTGDVTDVPINFATSGNKYRLTFTGGTQTFTNVQLVFPSGASGNFTLIVKTHSSVSTNAITNYLVYVGDTSTAATVNAVIWPGGSKPTITNTANRTDIISLYWDSDAQAAYGVITQDFSV